MNWWQRLVNRGELERQLNEELRDHVERLVADSVAAGMSEDEARRQARLEFGGLDQVKEICRDARGLHLIDDLTQDVRYALRAFTRNPGFTSVAVLTLALGIGATTAIFSVVDAVLLRPLPYPRIERVFVLSSSMTLFNSTQTGEVFHYVKDRLPAFARLAAYRGGNGWNLVVNNRAEYVRGQAVSSGYFEVLGVRPKMGREFTDAEDTANGPAAIIISDAIWRRYFDSRPDAVGRIVELGGDPRAVVGVMPVTFQSFPPVDVWTPLRVSPRDSTFNTRVIGRLSDAASTVQAAAEFDALRPGMKIELLGMEQNSPGRLDQIAWRPFQDVVTNNSRLPLLLLLTAVGFVLLIACANVAGLQLIRASARRLEMATRAALGAGPGRALRQVFTESLLLGLLGAAAGLMVAQVCLRAIVPQVSELFVTGQQVSIDWRVLGVTLVLAVLTSVAFGLWPALDVRRIDLRTALWEAGGHSTSSRAALWLRRTFVLVEVPLAAVLLVGAGLFIRALVNLTHVDLGFEPTRVVTAQMSMQGHTSQTVATLAQFYERTLDRIRELPGVEAAAVGNNVPVERGLNVPIEPAGSITQIRSIEWRYITPDYFTVFRVPLIAGRTFDARDGAPGLPVALVNEAFARAYFGNGLAATGQSIQIVRALRDSPREIVGVVGDVKSASGAGWAVGHPLAVPAPPTVYVPAAQVSDAMLQLVHRSFPVNWAVRVRGFDPSVIPSVTAAVQQVMGDIAPTLPIIRFTTMEQVIERSTELQRTLRLLLGVFAGLALLLAAIGIYGLLAFSVAQRTHEIGVRMALGATQGGVLQAFLGESVALVGVGAAIGLGAAAGLARFITAVVFGVEPLDRVTFGSVAAVLVLVACLAGLIPALRAARVEPMVALRHE